MVMELFIVFFKIGLFTFGGGYAMIPLIKTEVLSHGWATVGEIIDFIGISESTPGPFAINIATFIGFDHSSLIGAFSATLGVVLPSFVIIILISKFFFNFQDNKYVQAVLAGLRPAVVGTIAASAMTIFTSVFILKGKFTNYTGLIILAVVLLLKMKFKDMHPIVLIIISGFLGYLFYGPLAGIMI